MRRAHTRTRTRAVAHFSNLKVGIESGNRVARLQGSRPPATAVRAARTSTGSARVWGHSEATRQNPCPGLRRIKLSPRVWFYEFFGEPSGADGAGGGRFGGKGRGATVVTASL